MSERCKVAEAIEKTKNYRGFKVSFSGTVNRCKKTMENSDHFILDEMLNNYSEAKEAWLKGDLNTVASFFAIYV
jgi:hypothetical protein